jgi:hypothetical protein
LYESGHEHTTETGCVSNAEVEVAGRQHKSQTHRNDRSERALVQNLDEVAASRERVGFDDHEHHDHHHEHEDRPVTT